MCTKHVVLEYLSVSQAVTLVILSVIVIVKILRDIFMLYVPCIVFVIICLHQ